LEKQGVLDQIQIKTLETKVHKLSKIEDLNQNLLQLANLVRSFLAADLELMIANNLLKEVYKSKQDPKLVKIITCNKKYASEIKDCVGKLSYSLGETMDHLIQCEERLRFKADQELQKSSPKLTKVLGTTGTRARSLSGLRTCCYSFWFDIKRFYFKGSSIVYSREIQV
jgi:hypothetical protein